jgi:menaquinone-dependent protoporphyrinogen oxidase
MAHVLIIYASDEGQAARIVERIAERLREQGHSVDPRPADALGGGAALPECDGIIVGASVHYGKHPGAVARLVREHLRTLQSRPGAFFSVSLSAGGPVPRAEDARRYVDDFLGETGWRPDEQARFAGALRYSRYPLWKRFMMLRLMRSAGGDSDSSRDYEYTDWDAVDSFADAFSARLGGGPAR